MSRNVECVGDGAALDPCGWRGERFPNVKMLRYPGNLWDQPVLTDEYIAAVSRKPCPACGGIVLPIVGEGVAWPANERAAADERAARQATTTTGKP